jgi:signal recognition particle subunit SRP68
MQSWYLAILKSLYTDHWGRWIQLLLASSERAWASAMAMKSAQSTENTQKPMPGSTKKQIASRLRRAINHAQNLVEVLQDRKATGANAVDDLEARAYLSMLQGSLCFEKGQWQSCINAYSLAYIVYTALGRLPKTDVYKDLLSTIVEPSIRYAAYQQKLPRTKAIHDIAVENFQQEHSAVRKEIEELNPQAFATATESAETRAGPKDVPATISWRNRNVKLEDASISQALGLANENEGDLNESHQSFQNGSLNAKDFAAAYEGVITATQDAADAAKSAIDELTSEGVDTGDARMQSLQITRTAINYAVIEWRIGRNRVLCGAADDGLDFSPEKPKQNLKPRKDGKPRTAKEEPIGRQMSRLRERVALYDSILQSLDAVKELPGVIADTAFVEEINAKRAYFRALKCTAIARSHAINDEIANALALYARASELANDAAGQLSQPERESTVPKLDVSTSQVRTTSTTLQHLTLKYRALADLKLLTSTKSSLTTRSTVPLIERLHHKTYDSKVDLSNIVSFPPKLRPVPVKPLFFDLAWNYIRYPGQKGPEDDVKPSKNVKDVVMKDEHELNGDEGTKAGKAEEPKKRGWFGFGR